MKKICSKCKCEKNLTEFAKDRQRKDGRRYECKVCQRAASRSGWTNKYADKYKDQRAERRLERRALIDEAKKDGCICCDESELICLDFHHIDHAEKEYSVAGMLNFSEEAIRNEISKCVVVCANCHRKIHAGLIEIKG